MCCSQNKPAEATKTLFAAVSQRGIRDSVVHADVAHRCAAAFENRKPQRLILLDRESGQSLLEPVKQPFHFDRLFLLFHLVIDAAHAGRRKEVILHRDLPATLSFPAVEAFERGVPDRSPKIHLQLILGFKTFSSRQNASHGFLHDIFSV
jgi:hypothetical protein